MKSTVIIIVVVILVILGIVLFGGNKANAPETDDTGDVTQEVPAVLGDTDVEEMVVVDGDDPVVITRTDKGYSPRELTIQQGQTVTFLNEGDSASWPASAQHPTHTVYPEQTDNDCLGSAFDACRGLETGESWSFTFNQVGEWFYHDHLRPSDFGKITVE